MTYIDLTCHAAEILRRDRIRVRRIRLAFFANVLAALIGCIPFASASAKDEGWLSALVVHAIRTSDAGKLGDVFSDIRSGGDNGPQLSAVEAVTMLKGCELSYAEDRVFLNAQDQTLQVKTGAMTGFVCASDNAVSPDTDDCWNEGYSLVSPATDETQRTLLIRSRKFWATDRCGPERAPAAISATPADTQVKAVELVRALVRQIKPHWRSPRGADGQKLATFLSFELNPDGTLVAPPKVDGQEGVTTLNRELAPQHAANAIAAVTHASPFNLPPEDYEMWKRVSHMRFDWQPQPTQ